MAILKAMYQGVTVIVVKAPGPEQIIEDTKTGFMVNNKEQMMEIVQKGIVLEPEMVREYTVQCLSWDMTAGIMDGCIMQKQIV